MPVLEGSRPDLPTTAACFWESLACTLPSRLLWRNKRVRDNQPHGVGVFAPFLTATTLCAVVTRNARTSDLPWTVRCEGSCAEQPTIRRVDNAIPSGIFAVMTMVMGTKGVVRSRGTGKRRRPVNPVKRYVVNLWYSSRSNERRGQTRRWTIQTSGVVCAVPCVWCHMQNFGKSASERRCPMPS